MSSETNSAHCELLDCHEEAFVKVTWVKTGVSYKFGWQFYCFKCFRTCIEHERKYKTHWMAAVIRKGQEHSWHIK